jgi:hypothetical protein
MRPSFICAVCGCEKNARSRFVWLLNAVSFFYGTAYASSDPVCVDCAPRFATIGGRLLYVLLAIGVVAIVLWFPFR